MTKSEVGVIISGVVVIIGIGIFLVINPFVIISAGERGVVLNWGAVSDEILDEGIHLRTPIKQKIVKLDVQTQKSEVDAVAYSKDIQTVSSKIALNYHLVPETVNKLYQEVGLSYAERIISPAIQEAVKAATAKFNAQELIEERQKVKDEIKNSLKDRLLIRDIVIDELSIVNFDFSDVYEQAVEQKQVAQQQALKAENDLKRIKTEAEQRISQAKGEAEAIKIQAEAVNAQGGADYVQLMAIQKWDGKLPTQFIPGSTIPFLNLIK
jgi:regulator of protease activity HflC (stomatin/prohibitin superfamily)